MQEQTNTMSHSSQGDSPASRFPLPGSAEALKMTVTSGRKCLESSKSSPPLGCLEKMLLGSSTWGSKRRFLIWKEQAMKSGPSYYLLSPSARGMRGNGYSLPDTYPTPVASIGKMDVSTALIGRMKKTGTLKKLNSTGTLWQPNLQMKVFCTPEVMEQMGTKFHEPETEEQKELFTEVVDLSMKQHKINPDWVEWLMGFPIGWTDTGSGDGSRKG